ncbi:MAG: hypothetical protein IPK82_17650 [Polyangiaceae bacterium]|nr:hypothetical protein [Polyangiaceae bacterium]
MTAIVADAERLAGGDERDKPAALFYRWEGVRHDFAGWLRPAAQRPKALAPKRSR